MEFRYISEMQALKDGLGVFFTTGIPFPLPKRATASSAGYDFVAQQNAYVSPGGIIKIPTGVRAIMEDGWVLLMFVRSSIGIKKNLVLANGTGVIDADYWQADNEGHIWIVLHNYGTEGQYIEAGERIAQGVFVRYGSCGEIVENVRVGGIGSTN